MVNERFQSVQWFVGFFTLACVLLSALALGANRPVSWSLLTFVVLALFALQVLRALVNRLPFQLRGLWIIGLLFFAVLGWTFAQTIRSVPQAWVHPLWELVEAQGTVSADPGKGGQGMVRLTLYAMVFIISAWTFTQAKSAWLALRIIALWSTVLAIFGFYTLAVGENPILGEAASNVMTASFVNRNSYATYAMFGVLTNLGVYLNMVDEGSATAGKRRWRNMIEAFFGGAWIFAIGTLLCLAAVALTASRAGALSGIVGLIVFALAWATKQQSSESGRSTASGLLVFVGLTALVGFIAYASSDILIGRL
ncbi:hypothetical protein, partial [Congregibacter sp.]|uniref:hypothetical protein n=1 Tax=Congregibacter sp. TaxID=2744308 RepID=UPI00385EC399